MTMFCFCGWRWQLLFLLQAMPSSCRAQDSVQTSASTSDNSNTCQPKQSIQACMCSTENMFNGIASCVYKGDNRTSAKMYLVVKDQECVTYDSATGMLLGGNCPFRFESATVPGDKLMIEMNAQMCGVVRRGGTLCGACADSSEFSFNTLTMDCVSNCRAVTWTVYFIMDLVPIVIFFVCVAAFNIQATTPYASAFILYAQMVSLRTNVLAIERNWTFVLGHPVNNSLPQSVTRGLFYFYSIWNLDIMNALYPSLCLNVASHSINTLHALAFQYTSAVFSLLLIVSVYYFMELYERNFHPIALLCMKPFRVCFAKFRRLTDCHPRKTSIIDILATFVVLSYTKFTIASFEILAPAWTYNLSGERHKMVMYYDSTVEYFEGDHKAYAALAIAVLIFFVLPPPLLLMVYPLRSCQRWLDRLNLRCHMVTAFTDAFQGCFKDGYNNTSDCRSFSSVYFLLRIVVVGCYSFAVYNKVLLLILLQCTVCITAALLVITAPYKNSFYNKLNVGSLLYYSFVINLTAFNGILIDRNSPSLAFQCFYWFSICLPMVACFVVIATMLSLKLRKNCRIKYVQWSKRKREDCLGHFSESNQSLLAREEIADDNPGCFPANEHVALH